MEFPPDADDLDEDRKMELLEEFFSQLPVQGRVTRDGDDFRFFCHYRDRAIRFMIDVDDDIGTIDMQVRLENRRGVLQLEWSEDPPDVPEPDLDWDPVDHPDQILDLGENVRIEANPFVFPIMAATLEEIPLTTRARLIKMIPGRISRFSIDSHFIAVDFRLTAEDLEIRTLRREIEFVLELAEHFEQGDQIVKPMPKVFVRGRPIGW